MVVLFLVSGGVAEADKKIQDLIPNHEREHTACLTQMGGMVKVANGVALLAKSATDAERPELEKAAAALGKGSTAFTDYCNELGNLVTYLKDNSDAAYKSVEREIDTRVGKVSKLRREGKRLAEELGPLTRKMIPRIMKLPTAAAEPEKRTPVKFPSGRTVHLPVLAGSWKTSGTTITDVAEYEDKQTTATVTTRQLAGDCSEHKPLPTKEEPVADMEVQHDSVAWAVRYVRKEKSGAHAILMLCSPRRESAVLATIDLAPDTSALGGKLLTVGLEMLGAYELKP